MILTSWVWVAPEKAEAATYKGYDVTVTFNSGTVNGTYSCYVYYWPTSGSSFNTNVTDRRQEIFSGSYSPSGPITVNVENGFPYKIYVEGKANQKGSESGSPDQVVNVGVIDISINNKPIFSTDNWGLRCENGGSASETWAVSPDGKSLTNPASNVAMDWPLPVLGLDAGESGAASIELTAPKNGGTTESETETYNPVFMDTTYNTNWLPSVTQTNTSIVLKADGKERDEMTVSTSENSVSVTAKQGSDKYNPGNEESDWVVKTTFNSYGKAVDAEIPVELKHPVYSVKFDPNEDGHMDQSMKTLAGDFYYGSNIFTVGGLSALPGFDAEGKPTGEVYKENCQLEGWYSGKIGDNGLTGTTSYQKLGPTITVDRDCTYYAYWETADINVKFETPDGRELATIVSKYGMSVKDKYGSATELYNYIYNNKVSNDNIVPWTDFEITNEGASNVPVWKQDGLKYRFNGYKIVEAYDMEGKPLEEDLKSGDITKVLKGDTVFRATYVPVSMEDFNVKFHATDSNAETEKLVGTFTGKYGTQVNLPDAKNVTLVDPEGRYKYTFTGWAPKYGAAYYTVDENGLDENGGKIDYIDVNAEKLVFIVEGDASYVPVFKREYIDYNVKYVYKTEGGNEKSVTVEGLHLDDVLTVPEKVEMDYTADGLRHYITGWKLDANGATETAKAISDFAVTGNMTLYADYNKHDAATYVIKFYDFDKKVIGGEYDDEGKLENEDDFIYKDGQAVDEPTVGDGEGFDIPRVIDTEDKLYTYDGWYTKNEEGSMTKVEEIPATAGAAREYYAIYDEQTYADVTFYNEGKEIYKLEGNKNSIFEGRTVPLYAEDEYGIPEKAADKTGTYTFSHWEDDNGTKVVPGTTTLTGDINLHAVYNTVYIDYTVIFENDNGDEILKKTYHYGDEIVRPETDPTKTADEKYSYKFRAWSPEVSDVCYGDATYTAVYTKSYKYYPITWYKHDKTVAAAPYYIYGERITAVSYAIEKDPEPGHTWVIKEWVQCNAAGQPIDADGNVVAEENAVRHTNSMKMGTEPLYFYAVLDSKTNVYEVKLYDETGDKYLGSVYADYNTALPDTSAYESAAKKKSDAEYHYSFSKWVDKSTGADINEFITSDCEFKAVLTAESHDPDIYEVIKYPTCTEKGIAKFKCLTEYCDQDAYEGEIAIIPDFTAPSITVQLGSKVWPANTAVDFTEKMYVSEKTNIIANATDTNLRSQWNPEGTITSRVDKVDYYISTKEIADTSTIDDALWTNAYSYSAVYAQVLDEAIFEADLTKEAFNALADTDAKKAAIINAVNDYMYAYEANLASTLDDNIFENGKNYIVYVRATDRVGNVSYASTGWFNYGSTAPTVTMSGEGSGTKFCTTAKITVTDDNADFVVTLDGETVALDENSAFTCSTAGVHTVTVTDKHGIKTTKTFEIAGTHSYKNYAVAPTCVAEGSRYDMCSLCGDKANEQTVPAKGHSLTLYTEVAPTCTDDGYRTYKCSSCKAVSAKITPDLVITTTSTNFANDEAKSAAEHAALKALVEAKNLKVDDLKHLKATGDHTYAKVKDENGKDTTEDAWVIDKAATCKVVGSKHKDCTVCGERVTAEVAVDTENGHKFYRATTTLKPTCTTKGEKTKTCRYCGEVVHVADIDALGHIAGEYEVTKKAKCEEKGSKILLCARCDAQVGEPIEKDGKVVGFDGKSVEIPALGHAMKAVDDPFFKMKINDEGEEVKVWYQKYECSNGCGKTEEKVTEYIEKVAVTVTFMNGNDDTAPQVFNLYAGDEIGLGNVTTPTKAADKTYKYTFKYWATRSGEGTEASPYTYTEAKFPAKITADTVYYAVYAEKYINYTITYYDADGEELKKVGYLHNGVEYDVLEGPAKKADWQNEYTFAGWELMYNTSDKPVVYTKTVTIDGKDISLKATYTSKLQKYAVTYAYSMNEFLETFEVNAGEAARNCAITPVKKADSINHYTFKKWNRDTELAAVKNDIYTTPVFETANHTFEETVKTSADCTNNKVITKTCTSCGYSEDVEVADTALQHLWTEDYNEIINGERIWKCQRSGCTETKSVSERYTATFYVDGNVYQTVPQLIYNSEFTKENFPANPSKADTKYKTYTFKGWKEKGSDTVINLATYKKVITANVEFEAEFTAETKTYRVTFAYDATNVIKSYIVEAGKDVTYSEAQPTKAYDKIKHYNFNGWKISNGAGSAADENVLNGNKVTNVLSDMYIVTTFTHADHTLDEGTVTAEASCTQGAGTIYKCTGCAYTKNVTSDPLPHSYKVEKRVEAEEGKDGYIKYKCENCNATKEDKLVWVDNNMDIVIYVKNSEGNPVEGAIVDLYIDGATDTPIASQKTNSKGQVVFTVDKDHSYSYLVSFEGTAATDKPVSVGEGNTNVTIEAHRCSCACHGDGIWSAIFRFFHKVIKMFTGEFKCCKDPDSRYN